MLVPLLMLAACGKEKEVKTFAETFADYVNSNQIDSIISVNPDFSLDSIAPLSTDSMAVTKSDGSFIVTFGEGKWIELEESDDGNLSVKSSKGIAAFPKEIYQLATISGMVNESTTDMEAKELLADSAYFAWLEDVAVKSIALEGGKAIRGRSYGEGISGLSMKCKITNNLSVKLEGKDYKITYTRVGAGEQSNNWRPFYFKRSKAGQDIEPGQTIEVTISERGDGLKDPKIELNIPAQEYFVKYYKPSGNEYQEYLNLKQ